MRMPAFFKSAAFPLFLWLAFFTLDANAAIDNTGILDDVLQRYSAAASTWATIISAAATRLFWALVVISMVWTFGFMALRKADIGEFFAEFLRFTIFTGFFWWLLQNGPAFADSIIRSLRQLGGEATGLGGTLSPSGIVDIGFTVFGRVLDQSSAWSPVDSAIGIIMSAIVLVILLLIGINMLLLLVSGWILSYGGVFFLGFGGSRWTSDMAINYYKTVLGIAAQLMTMVLLVGIGKLFLDDYYNRMSEGVNLREMGVLLAVAVILLVLTNKVPQLISGVITGASVGGAGIGTAGAGVAMAGAGMAMAGAAMGGAAIAAGAANISGGAQALMAAFKGAQGNVAAGTDVMSKMAGAMGGGSSGSAGSGGGSALSDAMGLGGGSSGGGSMGSGSSSMGGAQQQASAGGGGSNSSGGAQEQQASATGGQGGNSSSGDSQEQQASASGGQGGNSSSGGAQEQQASAGGGGSNSSGGTQEQQASASGGQGGSSSSGKLATAGKIAADMASQLASGAGRMAKDKALGMVDAAKDRVGATAGGKLAAEINNPGAKAQARLDDQVINEATEKKAQEARVEQVAEAKEYLAGSGSESPPMFEGDSISGGNAKNIDADNEVAAFRDGTGGNN